MTLADSWYTSATLWTAGGTVVVLISGVIATYLTLRNEQSLRLDCMIAVTPLLPEDAQGAPGRLKITWDGQEQDDAHLVRITLVNRGRKDIGKEHFEQELVFKADTTILAVLRTAVGPNSARFEPETSADHELRVGPGLIHRHESVEITMLIAGGDPKVTCSAYPVRDTNFRLVTPEHPGRRWSVKVKIAGSLTAAAATAGLVLVGILIGHASPQVTPGHVSAGSSPTPSSSPAPPTAVAALHRAETDLKSSSQATQLTGISLIQNVMDSWPAEQGAALESLAGFIHQNSPTKGGNDQPVTTKIQQALNVLVKRNPDNDNGAVLDFTDTNLTNANLAGINLDNATLTGTDFTNANLSGASLRDANLNYAFVGGANLSNASFTGANLTNASFYDTILCQGSTPTQREREYNCSATG